MKKKVFAVAATVLLVVAGLAAVLAMFNPQRFYRVHLGNDYYVMHVSLGLQTVSRMMSDGRSFERFMAGQITGLACIKHFAVGTLDTSVLGTEDFRDLRTEQSVPGYFILDSQTGRLHVGLDEVSYSALLMKYQERPPELKRLSRTQQLSCNFVLPLD